MGAFGYDFDFNFFGLLSWVRVRNHERGFTSRRCLLLTTSKVVLAFLAAGASNLTWVGVWAIFVFRGCVAVSSFFRLLMLLSFRLFFDFVLYIYFQPTVPYQTLAIIVSSI